MSQPCFVPGRLLVPGEGVSPEQWACPSAGALSRESWRELEARRDFLQARILDTRLFGAARLMKAFPAMKDLRHSELLAELKETLHERLHR